MPDRKTNLWNILDARTGLKFKQYTVLPTCKYTTNNFFLLKKSNFLLNQICLPLDQRSTPDGKTNL